MPNMKNYFLMFLITEKVFHYLSSVMLGGGGIMKKVTNCDILGWGSKTWHLGGDIIFDWLQTNVL